MLHCVYLCDLYIATVCEVPRCHPDQSGLGREAEMQGHHRGAQHPSHHRYKRHSSHAEAELIQQMTANIKERQNIFFDMEAYLPKKNGYEPSDFLLQAPMPCWGVRVTG